MVLVREILISLFLIRKGHIERETQKTVAGGDDF